ncbi:methyltransferase-like 26 [Xenopus tropicalis]|uniref:Methyltransferase-like 26 n=2 Tax=Xenopus tropicalis TaxID=8364 RepID=MTL26_XENTR|nr:methyltransferase-like 26 [Xenopus tropicalis]Q28FI7.2 RecName: Full=Methyltransferase-like 26 [Xenopus tropicalis]|eukprot:NP_001034823.2 methyltransferase-like 26 [Xenopus tropicalis]
MLVAAAADRNKGPILEVLQQYVDPAAPKVRALEVASGTGQHCAHFAQALPNLHLVPSELDPHSRQSISAYISHWSLSNVEQPRTLDSSKSWETWGFSPNSLHLIICINMIHITEPSCTQGLFKGAGHLLMPGGVLFTYGPYSVNGILTPQSNVDFNISLKRRNPAWGIWDTSDLQNLATTCGMSLERMVDMPANNKCLIFRKK